MSRILKKLFMMGAQMIFSKNNINPKTKNKSKQKINKNNKI